MINFKNTMDMYDRFIDRDYLSTQDLLSFGFNKNDLTKMIEDGKLKRPRRGYYEVGNVDGLFNYVKVIMKERRKSGNREICSEKRPVCRLSGGSARNHCPIIGEV